jgi:hypothetical protein
VPEWSIGAVSKTVEVQASVGSNPTLSVADLAAIPSAPSTFWPPWSPSAESATLPRGDHCAIHRRLDGLQPRLSSCQMGMAFNMATSSIIQTANTLAKAETVGFRSGIVLQYLGHTMLLAALSVIADAHGKVTGADDVAIVAAGGLPASYRANAAFRLVR